MKDVDENGVDRIHRFRAYSERFRQFSVAHEVYEDTLEYILHLRKERDEARRRVCEMSLQIGKVFRRVDGKTVEVTTPEGCAEIMRWDCFKENTND